MRAIWSGERASSFWNRSSFHHLKRCALAGVVAAASASRDNVRQTNNLRDISMARLKGLRRLAVYGGSGLRQAMCA